MEKYAVAEIFESIQGEGLFAGTPMIFVRLAGCNVGKSYHVDSEGVRIPNPTNGQMTCTSFDEQQFWCDTDYRVKFQMTEEEIVDRVTELSNSRIPRMCLTGGEPLIHSVVPLIRLLVARKYLVHIETSGTVPFPDLSSSIREQTRSLLNNVWVTCSPKHPFIESNKPRVDEWKFVVGPTTSIERIEEFVEGTRGQVFLQPVNFTDSLNPDNLKRCENAVRKHGGWRLSVQLHKILGVR